MFYATAAANAANAVKTALKAKYKITDLGAARQFLGLEIERTTNGIALGQQAYISAILNRFGMAMAHTAQSPLDPDVDLALHTMNAEGKADADRKWQYQSMVGSLMYLALGTRPDLAFAM